MDRIQRITHDPAVMGGRPCIRGMRVTVGTIVGLLASGRTIEYITARMKILLDMNLLPVWVGFFQQEGFVAIHWSAVGDPKASRAAGV